MNRLAFIGFVIILTIFTSCSSEIKKKKEMDYKDEKFEVGQVWKYKTREGEENSTIQIVKIDKYDNQEAFIHISIKGLKMKTPSSQGSITEIIGHLPFSRKSFAKSVTTLVNQKDKLSDFEEGYNNWKEAFEAKKGGVFTISISDAVRYVETTMNQ